MQIAPATKNQIPWIVEIWKEYMDFHAALDPFFSRADGAQVIFEKFLRQKMDDEASIVLLASENGSAAGFCIAWLEEFSSIYPRPLHGCITDMAVKNRLRRRGVASELFAKALAWLESRGIKRIQVNILATNQAARSFWEKMGFQTFSCGMFKERNLIPHQLEIGDALPDTVSDLSKEKCLFCEMLRSKKALMENALAFAVLDQFPVTRGHTLILPRRHAGDYFDMTANEREAVEDLLLKRRMQILSSPLEDEVSGFNIGVNCGRDAGQTIFHCHIHLIPRRKDDIADPRGGVRGVIPGKMKY